MKQCAKKLASDAREKKRDGCSVASTALVSMINQLSVSFFEEYVMEEIRLVFFFSDTNAHIYDELVLEKFHEKIAKQCDSHPAQVLAKLEEVLRIPLVCSQTEYLHYCEAGPLRAVSLRL